MNKTSIIFAGLLLAVTSIVAAQTKPTKNQNTRDLYLSDSHAGSMVTIELKRGSETSMVSPEATFRSGDSIRLHLKLNFSGYLAITNIGSTGKYALLFPFKGGSYSVSPKLDYTVPQNGYIVFDNTPGIEQLSVIFSTVRIPEVENAQESNGSNGGPANSAQEQQILAELNSKSVSRGSRDLFYAAQGDAAYAVSANDTMSGPLGITLNLKHQ